MGLSTPHAQVVHGRAWRGLGVAALVLGLLAACGGGGGGGSSSTTPVPTIASFAPASGGAGASVTVTGTDFTGATAVTFNSVAATTFNVVSGTSLTAVVPASAGTGPIRVTTPGGTAASSGHFTVIAAPTISSFTPATGGVGTTVVIIGTHLTGTTAVSFSGTASTSVTLTSDTQISAVVPSGASTGTISITTPGGTATSAASFTFVAAPAITSFTPTSGTAGDTVTVTGTNLAGTTEVTFNGVASTSVPVVSGTSVQAVVPASAGTGPIRITTPGGTAVTSTNFTCTTPVPAPTVASFTPTSGGAGTIMSIYGTHLAGVTAVTIGGTPASGFLVSNASRIIASVGSGTTGPVAVTSPGGTGTSTDPFTWVAAPGITSFAPSAAWSGSTVTLTGTNFTGASAVTFNGVAASTFSVVNATTITAVVPAGDTSGIITVATSGGHGSSATSFAGGRISLLAGWPSGVGFTDGAATGQDLARFHQPLAVAFDTNGILYVADYENSTVRTVDPFFGTTTLAGLHGVHDTTDGTGGDARFWGPAGLVVDSTHRILYVADSWNDTIRQINIDASSPNYRQVTTLAGVAGSCGYTATTFDFDRNGRPIGMVLSEDGGTLYVTDQAFPFNAGSLSHTVRAVNTGVVSGTPGVITLVAGTPGTAGASDGGAGVATFNVPLGLVRIGAFLYVADYESSAIRRIDTGNGNAVATLTLDHPLNHPAGLTTDGTDLFVTNHDGCTVVKVAISALNGTVTLLAGEDGTSGHVDRDGVEARFNLPGGLAIAPEGLGIFPSGTLLVADLGDNTIRTLGVLSPFTVGTYIGQASVPGQANGLPSVPGLMNNPTAIAADWAGGVAYVADTSNHMVRKVNLATGELSIVYEDSYPGTFSPVGIALGPTGTLYVADATTHALYTLDLTHHNRTQVPNTSTFTARLKGIAVSPVRTATTNYDVLFAADGNQVSGLVVDGTSSPVTLANTLNAVCQITVDSTGTTVYAADAGNNGIYSVSGYDFSTGSMDATSAIAAPFAGSPTQASGPKDGPSTTEALFFGPGGIAIDNTGTVFVADTCNQTVRLVTGGQVRTLVGAAGNTANIPMNAVNLPLPAGLSMPAAVTVRPTPGVSGIQMLVVVPDAVLAVGF
jgi:hypothetical protein